MSYVCTACNKSFEDPAERTCECKAPLLATMSATVYGRSSVATGSPLFNYFRELGKRILKDGV